MSDLKPETLALHAGWRADPTTGSVAVPIHQTTSYQFNDTRTTRPACLRCLNWAIFTPAS
jgi:O-acetylhomoserine/O-acetylserine sulfhydrylase-like pyridoxal-dependent enzyme